MMKIGVIGAGYWGPNLVRNFNKLPECRVMQVADLNTDRLQQLQEKYPDITMTTNYDELLDGSIDAVAIATPVSTHYQLAKKAIEKGKHVLLEKPMTANTKQSQELIEFARQKQKVLMVDHPWVYDGAIRKMKEIITGGQLGKVYSFESVRINLGLLQRDVNVVWDLAPHDFSIIDYVLETPPEWVSAIGICPVKYNQNPECTAYITIGLAEGVIAHVQLSWLSPEKLRKITVCGNQKMLVYNQQDADQIKVYDKSVYVSTANMTGTTFHYKDGDVATPHMDKTETLEVMCRHFLDCIDHEKTPITDGNAGLRVVRLLEDTQKSLKNGGNMVPVNFGGY